jgi:hypothetical protein
MKIKIILILVAVLFLAGCGSKTGEKSETEKALDVLNPAAQLQQGIETKNRAEERINDAINKENERLKNSLEAGQ